jgi:ribosomal protein L1
MFTLISVRIVLGTVLGKGGKFFTFKLGTQHFNQYSAVEEKPSPKLNTKTNSFIQFSNNIWFS